LSAALPSGLAEIDAAVQSARRAVASRLGSPPAPGGELGLGGVERLLGRARQAAARPGAVSAAELSAAAAEALPALASLDGWLARLGLGALRDGLDRATAGLALWLARHGAPLTRLEAVVDALARVANRTREPAELAALSDAIGEILAGVAPEIRADADDRDPARPWRVLNLNRGIVATRSHDPRRMEAAFETLVRNLPADAARFFQEGMGQMEALRYPAEVRAVMERYYREWSARTLH
jgi:hypothetical protein